MTNPKSPNHDGGVPGSGTQAPVGSERPAQIIDDKIFMGPAIPATGPDLSLRLVSAISQYLVRSNGVAESQARFRVNSVFTDPVNLTRLAMDISGYSVVDSVFTSEYVPKDQKPTTPAIVTTQPALLSDLKVQTDNLEVIGIPLMLDIQAINLPIVWLTDINGNVWLTAQEEQASTKVSSFEPVSFEQLNVDTRPFITTPTSPNPPFEAVFSFRANIDTARAKIREFAITQSKGQEVQVKDLDFSISQTGRDFVLKATAKLKYKIFGVRFKASAVVAYDQERLTVTPRNIKVGSSNLFARIVLGVAAKSIKKFDGQTVEINTLLKDNPEKFTALEIGIEKQNQTQELRIRGRLK